MAGQAGGLRRSSAAWPPARSAAPYAYGYGYGGPYGYGGCQSYAPIYDAYGNYLGQQLVNLLA